MSDTQNPPLLDEARAYYEQLLRPVFAGRKFVLPGIIAVLLGNVARQLGLLGVARPFLIAGSKAAPGEDPDASILFGPGPIGGFVSFSLDPDRNEPGPPSAPEVARAFRLADRLLGTDFGGLEAARDLRP